MLIVIVILLGLFVAGFYVIDWFEERSYQRELEEAFEQYMSNGVNVTDATLTDYDPDC